MAETYDELISRRRELRIKENENSWKMNDMKTRSLEDNYKRLMEIIKRRNELRDEYGLNEKKWPKDYKKELSDLNKEEKEINVFNKEHFNQVENTDEYKLLVEQDKKIKEEIAKVNQSLRELEFQDEKRR